MKKIIYTLAIIASSQTLFAQGFLNKIKNKVSDAVEKKTDAATTAATTTTAAGGGKFTDPSAYGTLIYTYGKDALTSHMGGSDGGFALWFLSVSTANNQLSAKIVDYDQVYNYSGGQMTNTGTKTTTQLYTINNHSELFRQSVNFSQHDMENAMMKKGQHVGSGMIPGKATQTVTFGGKNLGDYMMFQVAHNADSSAIAVSGATITKGLVYQLTISNGQTFTLPKAALGMPLISPDGKMAAALVQTAQGTDVYLINGSKITLPAGTNNKDTWLHNSGAVYSIGGPRNNVLYKNGVAMHTFPSEVLPKEIFIGESDTNFCWIGDHMLCFSDGTTFENGASPTRIVLNGKEMVIFMTINVTSGQLYLCKHEL